MREVKLTRSDTGASWYVSPKWVQRERELAMIRGYQLKEEKVSAAKLRTMYGAI